MATKAGPNRLASGRDSGRRSDRSADHPSVHANASSRFQRDSHAKIPPSPFLLSWEIRVELRDQFLDDVTLDVG